MRPTQGAGGEALPPRTSTQACISAQQPALARAPCPQLWRAINRGAAFRRARRLLLTPKLVVVHHETCGTPARKGLNLREGARFCARRTATSQPTRRARPNHSQNRLILHAAAYCAEDPGAPWPRKPPAPRTHRTAAQPQRPTSGAKSTITSRYQS